MIVMLFMMAKMMCQGPILYNSNPSYVLQGSTKLSYIKESFENWPPLTFTLSPETGTGAWKQSPISSADYISPQTGALGEHAAEFDSWDYSSGVSGDMISNPVDLSGTTNPVLSFYFWNHTDQTNYGNSDYVLVHISTDGGATWTLIDSLYGDVDTWTFHSYDLTSYIGDTVIVRFRGVSDYGGSDMGIDEVVLGQTPDYDAAVEKIISPVPYDSVHSITPKIVVSSEGVNDLTNFYVYAMATHHGNPVYVDSVFITSLPSGTADTLDFASFTPDSGFFYDFLFYTAYPGDGFPLNDSAFQRARFYYSSRMVIGELITNTGCSPCKPANDTLDNIFPDYPDKLALIRYHGWWPSNTDPFYLYNQSENTDRINYYGADYAPHLHIDGVLDGGASRDEWRGMFEGEFDKKTAALMSVTGSYNALNATGELNVNISFTGEPTDSMLKLRVALVENGIRYNASNGQTVFYQVFRKMYPDVNGTSIDFNAIGQMTEVSVPFSIDTTTFDEDSLEFVAFLQSDVTGEILQGAKISLSELTSGIGSEKKIVNTFDISSVRFAGKNTLELVISMPGNGDVNLSVYDLSGRVVKSMVYGASVAGVYRVALDTRSLPNGIYFVEGRYRTTTIIKKFTVLK